MEHVEADGGDCGVPHHPLLRAQEEFCKTHHHLNHTSCSMLLVPWLNRITGKPLLGCYHDNIRRQLPNMEPVDPNLPIEDCHPTAKNTSEGYNKNNEAAVAQI